MNPTERISQYISSYDDWRGQLLSRLRDLILTADHNLTEEWKWNSPVWSKQGLVCSISAFKQHVAVSFFQGTVLDDPNALLNTSADAKAMRSIKLREGDALNELAFQDLVRAAVAYNAIGK